MHTPKTVYVNAKLHQFVNNTNIFVQKMIKDELALQISNQFKFPPTADQQHAIDTVSEFLTDRNPNAVMILRGSAGTGKTYLSGRIVQLMRRINHKVCLLAPTGRAAKVFALSSSYTASTIHRVIYRQRQFTGEMSGFVLDKNLHHNTLFIIDESSMIANEGLSSSAFGEGRLLDDLIQYVYDAGTGCRLLLTGDAAQLPPVGEYESPALSADVISSYGLKVYEATLNEVLRQSAESGILYNATVVRSMIGSFIDGAPKIHLQGFADISIISGNELIDSLSHSYSDVGVDETIVVTRSNKRANIYNMGIRRTILDNEEQLSYGDMLMVVRNNYYWPEHLKSELSFIANGDRAMVRRVRKTRELYGFTFADVTLRFPDYDDCEMEVTAILDTLASETPSLSREQNDKLFHAVMEDYMDIPQKRERMERIKNDPYFNAVQIKFAYAVTCHKAQGGQWEHVYVDQGYMSPEMYDDDYIRWLYTAFTRASSKLFLVNYPQK